MATTPRRWDIFCKVVDNYGDAGVSWRLARMLAREHGLDVTLWIDSPATLARIAPQVPPCSTASGAGAVTVRQWTDPWPSAVPADVVVEAFGCGLPDDHVEAMAGQTPTPSWFILEYLSAEDWVESAHGLPSPHPRFVLARRFWFPGFTPRTGGLLRERDLFARRDAFVADACAQAAFWSPLGIPPARPKALRISLFCYPNPALPALLDAWSGGALPHAGGEPLVRGRLRLHSIPFVDQDAYDRLLWACDINFVRGEDSFVRAQWASKPFVWHIYPQADNAHLPKLGAFLSRYGQGLDTVATAAVDRFTRSWNGDPASPGIGDAWREFSAARPRLVAHGQEWAERLAALPELAAGLVTAAAERV